RVKEKYGFDCFADDTGLMVDALGGDPGVYSARYAGPGCTPDDNVELLLHKMEGIGDRHASFRTVIALIIGDKTTTFTGQADGSIALARDGQAGFGYDPIFISAETGKTFASMTADEKNAISHRGRAVGKLCDYLRTL
ncbi:MAG: non-canonical purine NTP pyrophosphatase, partial [Muribaculaceae bacterium]|nr:non-canonical purine NTP pyrophosphatase [Muribaculaceae bacterium]